MVAGLALSTTVAAGTLTVSGQARLEIPADQFSLSIGVSHTASTVDAARAKVDPVMNRLIETVDGLKLKRHKDWRTSRYDVSPQWKPRPRNAGADWTPEIIGYKVRSGLAVTSTKMDVAGQLIAKAAEAGANDIGAVQFSLADPRTSRQEAIQTAARHAITDASSLASASHVRLMEIRQLSLDGAQSNPPRPAEHMYMAGTAMMRGAAADKASAPDISGGMVTVTASVTAEWEIAPISGAQTEEAGSSGHEDTSP